MERFIELVINGIGDGTIYATLALAVVLIFRTTGIVNFAQGEMAMFSTFGAWALTQAGLPIVAAVPIILVLSFIGGALLERVIIRPVEGRDVLSLVIVTLGLFIFINALAGLIWGFENRGFPNLLPTDRVGVGGIGFSVQVLGTLGVLIVVVALLYLLFQRTKIGLAIRAAATNPDSSRLVGVKVGQTLMIGWGLAAVLGALAGVLVAPRLFLDVNLMLGVLIYSFAAAALGGFDSPIGAVLGGLIIGVVENVAANYIGFITGEMRIIVPLVIIFAVLLVRPQGLFGSPEVARP